MTDINPASPGPSTAVVHVAILYDVVCHECGWESAANPFIEREDAERAADWHRCGDVKI